MRERKPFYAERPAHDDLVLTYMTFPELMDVFQNIACGLPLTQGVRSKWDTETLEGHTRRFILPRLESAGVVRASQDAPSGYVSDYTDLVCPGVSNVQLAPLMVDRTECIAASFQAGDSMDDAISASCNFRGMPKTKRLEIFARIRDILHEAMNSPDDLENGETFRIVLVGRAEK